MPLPAARELGTIGVRPTRHLGCHRTTKKGHFYLAEIGHLYLAVKLQQVVSIEAEAADGRLAF